MTSRERVRLVLNNKIPDRLPFNFWIDRDKMSELEQKLGENFRVTHYGADIIETFPMMPFFAEFAGNAERIFDGKTWWTKKYAVQSVTELAGAPMFDPDNPALYDYIRADRAKYPGTALFALVLTPLEILLGAVGMEQLFLDMGEHDGLIEELCENMSQVQLRAIDYIAEADMDVLYLAGDICSTKSSMLSPDMLRRFFFEPVKKLVDRAHERDLKVFYHTDGHVMDILPLFIEYGFDGINPLQANADNNIYEFAEKYGDKLMVYGAMDNCFTIPQGSAEDVRRHVRELFDVLGKNGRFIASSHDIPSYAPMENIEAMVETIKSCVY
jgi:uroporphyrinogen-III decarboxylase